MTGPPPPNDERLPEEAFDVFRISRQLRLVRYVSVI